MYLNGKGDVSIRTEPPSLVARTMVEPSTCHERRRRGRRRKRDEREKVAVAEEEEEEEEKEEG